jgi:FtsX-like permease family
MPLLSFVMSVAVRTRIEPLSLVEQLGREDTGGQVLHDVHTLEQLAGASLARLALVLACVGIYGVLAYLTSRRMPEIGVRMALGATARGVMWLVLRQSLAMICVGVGAGLVAAVAAAQMLTRFVDGMLPAEPSTFRGHDWCFGSRRAACELRAGAAREQSRPDCRSPRGLIPRKECRGRAP